MDLKIQPRDIQVMKFVFACRAVTYRQIVRRHFSNVKEYVARRRIRRLADAGFLSIVNIPSDSLATRVIQPLPKMWPIIAGHWPFDVDNPLFKSESIEHDIRAAEMLLRFEGLRSFRSYYPENLLQSSSSLANKEKFRDTSRLQSDGALAITSANGELKIYAVELELSKKSPERYRQKLTLYHLCKSVSGVLYISPQTEIEGLIGRTEKSLCKNREPKVHFAFEQDVLNASSAIKFKNFKGGIIELP